MPMRKVTRENVRNGPAPDMSEDSSNEGSVAPSAADIIRNVNGAKPTPSIRIMPHIE